MSVGTKVMHTAAEGWGGVGGRVDTPAAAALSPFVS